MEIGRIFDQVNPVGGIEKANAVEASLRRTGFSINDVIYIGDSITDVQAMELVDSGGGIAVSFNGNRYAIGAARWAILSSNTAVIAGICRLLLERGMDFLEEMHINGKGELEVSTLLQEMKFTGLSTGICNSLLGKGEVEIYDTRSSDIKDLIEKSERIRKGMRGQKIGGLG